MIRAFEARVDYAVVGAFAVADVQRLTELDMRPAAVSRRLRTLGSLTALCLRLGRRAVGGGRRSQAGGGDKTRD